MNWIGSSNPLTPLAAEDNVSTATNPRAKEKINAEWSRFSLIIEVVVADGTDSKVTRFVAFLSIFNLSITICLA
jgi:hypothetical protein